MSKCKDCSRDCEGGKCDRCSISDYLDNTAECLECGDPFEQETDLQLCSDCMGKFDTDKLWRLHDENKLDALDFNENKNMREKFRVRK